MSDGNIAENVTSAIARLDGVRQVLEFVKAMSVADARWVLAMAQQTLDGSAGPQLTSPPLDPAPANGHGHAAAGLTLVELIERMEPETDYDKILAVGYYLQQIENQGDFDSLTITTQLREVGYRVSNITRAIDELTARTPALMLAKKTGDTRQARRRCRLTQHGIRHVQARLADPQE